ncbi:MAG TPA: putative Ig domain-containing protein [Burkholderiaceae bacterium]|jgi:hypothetical protein
MKNRLGVGRALLGSLLVAGLCACGGGGDGGSSGGQQGVAMASVATPGPALALAPGLVPAAAGDANLTLQYQQPQAALAIVVPDPATYVAQAGDQLSYAIASGALPTGIAFDPATAAIRGTPSGVGRTTVRIVATLVRGGTAYSSAPFAVTLNVSSSLVQAAYSQPCAAPAGSLLTCAPVVTIAPSLSGETLRFIAPDLPAGFAIDPATGIITGATSVVGDLGVFVTLRTTYADGSFQDDLPDPQPLLSSLGAPSTNR